MVELPPNQETEQANPYAWSSAIDELPSVEEADLVWDTFVGDDSNGIFANTLRSLRFLDNVLAREDVARLFGGEDELKGIESELAKAGSVGDQMAILLSLSQQQKAGLYELSCRQYMLSAKRGAGQS